MKRRQFIRSLLAAASLPSLQRVERAVRWIPGVKKTATYVDLNSEIMERLFRDYITPGLIAQLKADTKLYDRFR